MLAGSAGYGYAGPESQLIGWCVLLQIHAHDTLGCGVANVLRAVDVGRASLLALLPRASISFRP